MYVGARLSSRAPDAIIRPILVFVLLASSLKLLGVSTQLLGFLLLGVLLVGLAVWGAIDAATQHAGAWELTGLPRTTWVRWQAYGAPFGIGFAVAVAYFARVRPQLVAAAVPAVEGT